MRNWYKYLISDKLINNLDDRFLFSNYQLIDNNKNFKDIFNFENFKQNRIFFKQYNFLKNNLDHQRETLFIGSSWGESEFFLKDKFKIIASDSEDEYVEFHKNNTNLEYIKLDILNLKNQNLKYDQIVINSIEYLFDNTELERCIKNISKISKPGAKIFIIFRSRDGLLLKFIDHVLKYLETYLLYLIRRIRKKKVYFLKGHHGFRRSLKEIKKIWVENNFEYQSVYEDLYESDYNRLNFVRKLKISYLLSIIFLKSHPYLNIIHFKKVN